MFYIVCISAGCTKLYSYILLTNGTVLNDPFRCHRIVYTVICYEKIKGSVVMLAKNSHNNGNCMMRYIGKH